MYREFLGAVDHRMVVCCAGDFFVLWRYCYVMNLGLTAYAVKRPMGRAAITCGDVLKGIGDMPQQAV